MAKEAQLRVTPEISAMFETIRDWVERHGRIWQRRVLYELVSHQLVPDTSEKQGSRVNDIFKRARHQELIPWEWFKDEKSVQKNVGMPRLESFDQFFHRVKDLYEVSTKHTQNSYIEIWSEKTLLQPVYKGFFRGFASKETIF